MERFLWICLAGAAGTGVRYLIALWSAQRLGADFPFGTLIVNVVGCFAIAAVEHAALTLSWSTTFRSAITIGFLGGLTTWISHTLILRIAFCVAPVAALAIAWRGHDVINIAGLALMVYPYFADTVTALVAIGVVIAVALWTAIRLGW